MENVFEHMIYEPIMVFYGKIIRFLPNLFSALFIIILGVLAFWLTRFLVSWILKALKFDKFTNRLGINKVISRGGVREPVSMILGRFMSWIVLLLFITMALGALNVPAVERLIEKIILYLPNIFIAMVMVFLGIILANFFGNAALITSVNAGFRLSGLIGKSVRLVILLISISIAMEQLGIGKQTVQITFGIIFGSIALAFAIALGFGGRDIAKEYLEKLLKNDSKKNDLTHL